MGFGASAEGCYNLYPGSAANTSDSKNPQLTCTVCGGCHEDPKLPNDACTNWRYPPTGEGQKWYSTEAQARDAVTNAARAAGLNVPTNDPSIKITRNGAGSTRVSADIFQNSDGVFGVNTVGGRQSLIVKNGALDLRWQYNQGFDTDSFAKYPLSGPALFNPGGTGGAFGYLYWLKWVAGFTPPRTTVSVLLYGWQHQA